MRSSILPGGTNKSRRGEVVNSPGFQSGIRRFEPVRRDQCETLANYNGLPAKVIEVRKCENLMEGQISQGEMVRIHPRSYAAVMQLADIAHLKCVFCGFEARLRYQNGSMV